MTSRQARLRVNAHSQDTNAAAAAQSIDRRHMLAISAVVPLMLQQAAQADDGRCRTVLVAEISAWAPRIWVHVDTVDHLLLGGKHLQ